MYWFCQTSLNRTLNFHESMNNKSLTEDLTADVKLGFSQKKFFVLFYVYKSTENHKIFNVTLAETLVC